ncbi:MAG TPA: GntR family transcriptional regulator [Solirubrobacterales bacterium]|nr:GntR family transcriptional regulator [Solirubrobacterales bacterium]
MPNETATNGSTGEAGALVDEIAAAIRERIMSGAIPIGGQLRQAELATELGVSRTPVREALRQLHSSGLIEVVPNRGAVVRVPSPWEVRDAYEVRAELEGLACERAVSRINDTELKELRAANQSTRDEIADPSTDDAPGSEPPTVALNDTFHTTIHRAADNEWLARAIKEINQAFPRNVSWLVLTGNQRQAEESVAEHDRVVDALEAGDAAAARAEMRAHVKSAGEQLARWYEGRSATVFVG